MYDNAECPARAIAATPGSFLMGDLRSATANGCKRIKRLLEGGVTKDKKAEMTNTRFAAGLTDKHERIAKAMLAGMEIDC